MKSLYDSKLYMRDVANAATTKNETNDQKKDHKKDTAITGCATDLDWSRLQGKFLAISGGTGMIGSFLIDMLMYRNAEFNQNIQVYVLGRNEEKAKIRFSKYAQRPEFHFVKQDINEPMSANREELPDHLDYVIHAASNTHPMAYSTDPIGTISANVLGTYYLLDWAKALSCKRCVFLSSVEIYGENKGDIDKFTEEYLGYIDCNTMRAGYPESKRTGEALCQAYIKQKEMDIVIPRLSRVYGPTMLLSDTKALSQFILKSVNYEDIVLKSEGTQEFSYSYVADAAVGIVKILLDGENGAAYNLASEGSDIKLRDLAGILAEKAGKQVVFDLPDAVEQAGYSKATKATLDLTKINELGFVSEYDMNEGLAHTVDVLREIFD